MTVPIPPNHRLIVNMAWIRLIPSVLSFCFFQSEFFHTNLVQLQHFTKRTYKLLNRFPACQPFPVMQPCACSLPGVTIEALARFACWECNQNHDKSGDFMMNHDVDSPQTWIFRPFLFYHTSPSVDFLKRIYNHSTTEKPTVETGTFRWFLITLMTSSFLNSQPSN